ncbi:MAG: DNA-directed RNA polymerase subunit omega [Planctomycetaceae bacterium]|jgi:DNA-directed RNA polymerase subunit omega|nr:DNA-directed RNA polymerase subunit omega [Planctomycetaceae bacterium]
MIEELKDEELIRKIGGRFKLSALIQKRLVALNKGARSPVETDRFASSATKDKLNTVIREILGGKIELDTEGSAALSYDRGVDRIIDSDFSEGY